MLGDRSKSCWAGWRRHSRIMRYVFRVECASNIATQLATLLLST